MRKQKRSSSRFLTISAALTALLLVSACETNRPHKVEGGKPSPAWTSQERYLSELATWEMNGRVGSGLGFSGQLDWIQHSNQSYVKVRGPLGIGALEIAGNAEQVSLKDKHGVRTVVNPDQVLRDDYGLPLPLDYLRWWMLGIAAPNENAGYQFDSNGNAAEIHQAGWRVALSSYQPYGCDVILPRKMTLLNGDHKLKVIIKQWMPLGGHCGADKKASANSALTF